MLTEVLTRKLRPALFHIDRDTTAPGVDAEVEESEVRSQREPLGTFVGEQHELLAGFEVTLQLSLTLKKDRTYRFGVSSTCRPTPCPAIVASSGAADESGRYELTKVGRVRHIRFVDSPTLTQDYTYEFDGKILKSTGDQDREESSMVLSQQAWCAEVSDCTAQNLDGDGWRCADDVCTKEASPPASACEAAGGKCAALAPPFCDDMPGYSIASADEYPCGAPGQLGSMCCLPDR